MRARARSEELSPSYLLRRLAFTGNVSLMRATSLDWVANRQESTPGPPLLPVIHRGEIPACGDGRYTRAEAPRKGMDF